MSDEQVSGDWEHPDVLEGVKYARDFYEAKITSGELMVVKTAKWLLFSDSSLIGECSNCRDANLRQHAYCPKCGAKIVEG